MKSYDYITAQVEKALDDLLLYVTEEEHNVLYFYLDALTAQYHGEASVEITELPERQRALNILDNLPSHLYETTNTLKREIERLESE